MGEPQLKVALVALNAVGYQSLALGYLQAYAQADRRLEGKVGFQALDVDVSIDPWLVAYRVLNLDPDVVGFSVTCWNARLVYDACRVIGIARPDVAIVLGGPEVGPIAEDVLRDNPHVGAIVRDEGEVTFAEVLDTLLRRRRLWMVAGVTARNGDEVVSAPDRPLVSDLDEIPSPYLTGVLQPREGSTYLETFRGCPHRCGYCFEGKGSTRIRSFSPERTAAELEVVAGAVDTFSFIDPVFNLTPTACAGCRTSSRPMPSAASGCTRWRSTSSASATRRRGSSGARASRPSRRDRRPSARRRSGSAAAGSTRSGSRRVWRPARRRGSRWSATSSSASRATTRTTPWRRCGTSWRSIRG